MAPLPAPAEKPSHRLSEPQSHAKVRPPAQVAVFCAALWPNLQPALTPSADHGDVGHLQEAEPAPATAGVSRLCGEIDDKIRDFLHRPLEGD